MPRQRATGLRRETIAGNNPFLLHVVVHVAAFLVRSARITFLFRVGRQKVEQQEGRLGPQPLVFRLHASHQHREAVLRDKRPEARLFQIEVEEPETSENPTQSFEIHNI